MRRALGSLALAAAGVAAALAIAEVGLRLFFAEPNFYVYDRFTGWALNPGAAGWQHQEGTAWLSINRDGLRGPELSLRKPPGTIRIAVLGDSFVEAQQVAQDQTFCAVMQRALGACLQPRARAVEVLNFGVDGYGTTQELITLRRRVWQFQPDVVVLAFFSGNDLRNNSLDLEGDRCRPFFVPHGEELILGGPFVDSAWFRAGCWIRFESRRSRVIALFSHLHVLIRDRPSRRKPAGRAARGVERGISRAIYRPPSSQAWRDAWQVTEQQIDLMDREVRSHHVPFLLVTVTNGIQVYPDPAVRAGFARRLGVTDLGYSDRRLKALGDREGFAVLNLAEPMARWADERREFLHGFRNTQAGTGHWNVAGHRLGGTLIAEQLCAMLNPSVARREQARASHRRSRARPCKRRRGSDPRTDSCPARRS